MEAGNGVYSPSASHSSKTRWAAASRPGESTWWVSRSLNRAAIFLL